MLSAVIPLLKEEVSTTDLAVHKIEHLAHVTYAAAKDQVAHQVVRTIKIIAHTSARLARSAPLAAY